MRPLFEVTSTALPIAQQRLASVDALKALMALEDDGSEDDLIESLLDRATADMVAHCKLATASDGRAATFARETCRATWFAGECRDHNLLLPWRVPVTTISSVVENGVALTAGTDFQLFSAATLVRLANDAPRAWSGGKIVVTFIAGWELPAGAPSSVTAAALEQTKYSYAGRDRDPALRSEGVPDVYTASWSVPGGDSFKGVLLPQVEAALHHFTNWVA